MGLLPVVAGGFGLLKNTISKALGKSKENQAQAEIAQPLDTSVSKPKTAPGNYGRAALIATSPQGVLGSDPTGRRKLLGNY